MKPFQDLPLPARILRAAFQTFGERGFDQTSMDEVAERAGTTKRTVYAHFTNKETLFRAAIAQATAWFLAELPALDPLADPEAELVRFANRFSDLSTWQYPVRLQRVAIAEAERLPDLAQGLHRDVIEGAEDRIARFLAETKLVSGPEAEVGASEMARLFLNMATAPQRFATLMQARKPDPQHPSVSGFDASDAWIRLAVHFFLEGLRARR